MARSFRLEPTLRPTLTAAVVVVVATTVPTVAAAHVKWFCVADVTIAPAPLTAVVTPTFLTLAGVFVVLVFVGFLVDAWFARRFPALTSSGTLHVELEEKPLRAAAGAYFLCLWHGGDWLLTPDLPFDPEWARWLQFLVAVLVLWRRSCGLAAIGIGVLYGVGIADYGLFHMVDYTYFLGIAGYLAATSLQSFMEVRLRLPLLLACLAFSLMWAAIEKFVYPQWTLFVLLEHPGIAGSADLDSFIVFAGFTEFSLAFLLATGRGLLRFGAALFMLIFMIAVPEFGHLDAIGHLPIIVILGLAILRGSSPLQNGLRLFRLSLALDAAATSQLYLASLVGFFAAYYGLHRVAVG